MYPGAIGQLLDAGGIVFVLKCLSCAPTLPHTFESAAAFTPHKTFACMHARQGRKASVFSAQKLVVSGQNGLNFKQWSEQRLCCGQSKHMGRNPRHVQKQLQEQEQHR